MKRQVIGTVGTVLLLMLATGAWAHQTPVYGDQPRISVSGEALVHVKPDKIVINLGIDTWDANVSTAKQKNTEVLTQVLQALKSIDIPEEALQTDHLSVDPQWSDIHEHRHIIGYFVRNRLAVTISEAEKIEQVLTSTLEAGVNQIYGLQFQHTELKTYREQARALALKAAKEKADKMSDVLGKATGHPIHIMDNSSDSWMPYGAAQIQLHDGNIGGMADTVVLGTLPIRAHVSVVFELIQKAGK
jgi:uncharacterized protein YggE